MVSRSSSKHDGLEGPWTGRLSIAERRPACFKSAWWRMSCTDPKASRTERDRFCSDSVGSPLDVSCDLLPGGGGGGEWETAMLTGGWVWAMAFSWSWATARSLSTQTCRAVQTFSSVHDKEFLRTKFPQPTTVESLGIEKFSGYFFQLFFSLTHLRVSFL